MPRIKPRTSSKKTKKQKQKQRKQDRHSDDVLLEEKVKKVALSSHDSLEQALAWIHGGKVNAKRLAKTLPCTARDLRDGVCDPDDLAQYLAEMSYKQRNPPLERLAKDTDLVKEQIATYLARTVPHLEDHRELFLKFQSALRERLGERLSSRKSASEPLGMYNVKVLFDETCEEWEDTLTETLYGGHVGAFRCACPAFKAPVEDMIESIETAEEHQFGRLKNELYVAASGISIGLDQINEACWECNSVLDDMKQCRGCNTALYCCHSCQSAAWKAGHRVKCSILGAQYSILKASLAIVDSAHSAGVMDGLHPNHDVDYHMAYCCSRWPYIEAKPRLFEENGVPDPSMNTFYENLGRIARGEWWIYSKTISLEQYNTERPQEGHMDTDHDRFWILSFLLCFNYFGSDAEVVITDPAALGFLAEVLFNTSFDALSWCEFIENMPPARYRQLYQNFYTCANGTNRKRARRDAKCFALNELRQRFHK